MLEWNNFALSKSKQTLFYYHRENSQCSVLGLSLYIDYFHDRGWGARGTGGWGYDPHPEGAFFLNSKEKIITEIQSEIKKLIKDK